MVFYALPNGNTIEETEGRRPRTATEWRYDIQHIAAQTRLLRQTCTQENIVVVYLEAQGLSWPTWRRQHKDASRQIRALIEDTMSRVGGHSSHAALVAHSGGGSLIFGLFGWRGGRTGLRGADCPAGRRLRLRGRGTPWR